MVFQHTSTVGFKFALPTGKFAASCFLFAFASTGIAFLPAKSPWPVGTKISKT